MVRVLHQWLGKSVCCRGGEGRREASLTTATRCLFFCSFNIISQAVTAKHLSGGFVFLYLKF
jgi:hypothetical protein